MTVIFFICTFYLPTYVLATSELGLFPHCTEKNLFELLEVEKGSWGQAIYNKVLVLSPLSHATLDGLCDDELRQLDPN